MSECTSVWLDDSGMVPVLERWVNDPAHYKATNQYKHSISRYEGNYKRIQLARPNLKFCRLCGGRLQCGVSKKLANTYSSFDLNINDYSENINFSIKIVYNHKNEYLSP